MTLRHRQLEQVEALVRVLAQEELLDARLPLRRDAVLRLFFLQVQRKQQ